MKKFNTYEELKEIYDKGKYNIFYKNGNTKYTVTHVGSTILCFDENKHLGMGAVSNFDVKYFYGIEVPVIEEEDGTQD